MDHTTLSEQLHGRATGVIFFSSFGALWLALSLGQGHRLDLTAILLLLAGWIALTGTSIGLMRHLGKGQAARPETEADRASQRIFRNVNLAQWAAIVAALVVLNILQLPLYIPSAIATIVGLHMFPLARLFRYPLHFVTGAALIAWAIATPLHAEGTDIPLLTSLGTGAILWISAFVTLTWSLGSLWFRMPRAAASS